ncbi:MAG TPA: dienelactone hydrolase family protein [Paracoccus sp. (in: a-proteobacteria)]|uniref:dienelactone hydrolase family protein n=1 Tax=Paracoccus sp. TaxID=267 RepID=UPI002CE4FC95|nr:dienelactone hydrolase family protein [Paracoccus sp. (in: a-proteobacteria)]HWL59226.1 dienelactone hydrolase family protein [Paracoccus sp. (in: a-proteobacteria)]
MRQPLILLALAVFVVAGLLAANTARNAVGWQPILHSPIERERMLAGSWRVLRPSTPGPHRAAILLSGCDGVHDNMEYWAQVMRAQGRAAIIVDSHAPRRLSRAQAWRAVCAGQILPGAERAGDLAVALWALRYMPGIDPSEVVVLGASHGGWSAMELMARLPNDAPPPGLTEWPAPPETLAAQIGPVILLYPYCGLISGAGAGPWPKGPRGLMILAEHDRIIDTPACRDMAESLRGMGVPLKTVVLPGTDHGFDQRQRSALSPLEFNLRARNRATMLVEDFLQDFASPRPAGI